MHSRYVGIVVGAALAALAVAPAAAGSPGQGPEVRYQVNEMIRGASIHGANGLAIDADGRLLVASVHGGELVAVNTQTGATLDRLGHDVGVDGPDDVALGPDGSIYWTDILTGEVGRLAPDGTTSKQLVGEGVNPIAFTEDGRLFVGQAFFGDGLYEVDPELVAPPRTVIADTATPPFATMLNGFDFGEDGMLYAPQPFLGRIVKIDPESGDLTVVAEGLPPESFSVEFDADGQLFANLGDRRVVTVDIEQGTIETVATIPRAGSLDNMVFDASGRLLVSDAQTGAVYVIAPGGGVRTLVKGGLILPGLIAVVPRTATSESLFVPDVWRLVEYDVRSGRPIDIAAMSWVAPGITTPWAVAPDDGNVIVTSFGDSIVQVWDPRAHEVVQQFTDFLWPLNALRFRDDLVVAELGTSSVVALDDNGDRTTLASGVWWPGGLAATDTELWAADWATGLVHQAVGDNAPCVVPGDVAPCVVATGLSFPEGMAVDRDGSLLVVESGAGRLTRIDPATGEKSTVADELATDVQGPVGLGSGVMSGVAVDSKGTIFVSAAGSQGSVIYRIKAVPDR